MTKHQTVRGLRNTVCGAFWQVLLFSGLRVVGCVIGMWLCPWIVPLPYFVLHYTISCICVCRCAIELLCRGPVAPLAWASLSYGTTWVGHWGWGSGNRQGTKTVMDHIPVHVASSFRLLRYGPPGLTVATFGPVVHWCSPSWTWCRHAYIGLGTRCF